MSKKRKPRRPARRAKARTIQPKQGRMNRLEAEYARLLDARIERGQVAGYLFDEINLFLAPNTWYRPDFFVVLADGSCEFHEVKGHWREDARVKFKVAAERHAWAQFLAVTQRPEKAGGGWREERLQ